MLLKSLKYILATIIFFLSFNLAFSTDLIIPKIKPSKQKDALLKNLSSNIRPMIAFTFERKKNDRKPLNFQGAWEPFVIENNSFPERIEFLNNWFTTGYLSENYEKIIINFPIIRSIRRIINSIIKPKGSAT